MDYKDEALTAVAEEDSEHMGLYNQNEAARVAVERELRVAGKPNGATNGASKRNGKGQPMLTAKPKKPFTAPDPANESGSAGEKAPAA
jgi:hypothetical protein